MQEILSIDILLGHPQSVEGVTEKVVMIPFQGNATGNLFRGEIQGTGYDTQTTDRQGKTFLSARYFLTGIDCNGEKCSIYIENSGYGVENCVPKIVTDSKALCSLQQSQLKSEILPSQRGITVKIYKV